MILEDERPLILISNDDGVSSRGIKALADVALKYADVVVVAPDGPYSGKSHSFTVMDELRVRKATIFGRAEAYAVKGTPVDCIKLGVFGLVPRRPSLVLSGINHGSNTSISVHYSGTLGAAKEAALIGIPAIALSLADNNDNADLTEACRVADGLIAAFFQKQLPDALLFNVNIPRGRVSGVRLARMAMGHWIERPQHFSTPYKQDLYWLVGHFEDAEPHATDTDEALISQGFAALTPIKIDVTDYDVIHNNEAFSLNF